VDSKCYCSAIKQYAADINALKRARNNLLYASDYLRKMHNQAEPYANTFRTAATPENVDAICAEIEDCGSQLYKRSIDDELDKLDLIIKNLTSTHDSMVTAERQYHASIASAADDANSALNTALSNGKNPKPLYNPAMLASD